MRVLLLACLTVLSILFVGQMDRVDRIPFSGEVRFQGKPLARGLIVARPEKGTDSDQITAMVENGRFFVDRKRGPVPGEYLVEIVEFDGHRVIESIPEKFNLRTVLKLKVRPEKRCHAQFDL